MANKMDNKHPYYKMDERWLEELNDQQREAVVSDEKKICVIAGPGCGKTKTLSLESFSFNQRKKINPKSILFLTFTKKATKEVKDRVENFLDKPISSQMWISNIHGFCYKFLKNKRILKIIGRFQLYDTNNKEDLIKMISKEYVEKSIKIDSKGEKSVVLSESLLSDIGREISLLKMNFFDKNILDCFEKEFSTNDSPKDEYKKLKFYIYKRYQRYLEKNNIFDFDDLIIKTFKILFNYEDIRFEYQNQFTHILVDEFQDVNKIQYSITKLLLSPKSNLFIVGDPNQTIYSFQGSR